MKIKVLDRLSLVFVYALLYVVIGLVALLFGREAFISFWVISSFVTLVCTTHQVSQDKSGKVDPGNAIAGVVVFTIFSPVYIFSSLTSKEINPLLTKTLHL